MYPHWQCYKFVVVMESFRESGITVASTISWVFLRHRGKRAVILTSAKVVLDDEFRRNPSRDSRLILLSQ